MKLLQLNVTSNWGSTGKIAEGIGFAALNRGWENYIAYGRYINPGKSNAIRVGTQLDVYRHYAKSKFLNQEGLGSKNATKNLVSKIKEISPEIIHLHNIHDHWLNYPILFDYLNTIDAPIVWTFHDCWAFTGGCAHFTEWGCREWQQGCKNCKYIPHLFNQIKKNFDLKESKISNVGNRLHIVSVSRWLDSLVSDSFLKYFNHGFIYNGIDTDVFAPVSYTEIESSYGLKDSFVILGVSSVWPEYKGLQDFLELRKRLDSKFIIVLIGLTKKQISELPNGIIGIERTTDVKELAEFYTRADVVVSFSKMETFGMTLVEGQACGTPSMAYNNAAMKEVISEKTGFSIPVGDIDAAVNYINVIQDTKPFSSDIIRAEAVKNFNAERQFNKYIDLYESLLSK